MELFFGTRTLRLIEFGCMWLFFQVQDQTFEIDPVEYNCFKVEMGLQNIGGATQSGVLWILLPSHKHHLTVGSTMITTHDWYH